MLFDLQFSCTRVLSVVKSTDPVLIILPPRYLSQVRSLLKFEIAILLCKHAQCLDGEDELVVGVGDHAISYVSIPFGSVLEQTIKYSPALVKDTFNAFLQPLAIRLLA